MILSTNDLSNVINLNHLLCKNNVVTKPVLSDVNTVGEDISDMPDNITVSYVLIYILQYFSDIE